MIEAKYLSGKSSYEDEGERPNDQLARELDNLEVLEPADLGWDTTKEVVGRSLLYLTPDASIPSTALRESLMEYTRKRDRTGVIYWTSWRYIGAIVEEQRQSLDDYQAIVLNDIRQLLEKKELVIFGGMTPLVISFDEQTYTFYSISPTCYDWPDPSSALEFIPTYSYVGGAR
jgi:hypothetical protein